MAAKEGAGRAPKNARPPGSSGNAGVFLWLFALLPYKKTGKSLAIPRKIWYIP